MISVFWYLQSYILIGMHGFKCHSTIKLRNMRLKKNFICRSMGRGPHGRTQLTGSWSPTPGQQPRTRTPPCWRFALRMWATIPKGSSPPPQGSHWNLSRPIQPITGTHPLTLWLVMCKIQKLSLTVKCCSLFVFLFHFLFSLWEDVGEILEIHVHHTWFCPWSNLGFEILTSYYNTCTIHLL